MTTKIEVNGDTIKLPCNIGDMVYVVERCGNQCGNFDDHYYSCIERLKNGKRDKLTHWCYYPEPPKGD